MDLSPEPVLHVTSAALHFNETVWYRHESFILFCIIIYLLTNGTLKTSGEMSARCNSRGNSFRPLFFFA